MAAGPTKAQIQRARYSAWRNLAKIADTRGLVLLRRRGSQSALLNRKDGGDADGRIALDLIRASNGEAALIWRTPFGSTLSATGAVDLIAEANPLNRPVS